MSVFCFFGCFVDCKATFSKYKSTGHRVICRVSLVAPLGCAMFFGGCPSHRRIWPGNGQQVGRSWHLRRRRRRRTTCWTSWTTPRRAKPKGPLLLRPWGKRCKEPLPTKTVFGGCFAGWTPKGCFCLFLFRFPFTAIKTGVPSTKDTPS